MALNNEADKMNDYNNNPDQPYGDEKDVEKASPSNDADQPQAATSSWKARAFGGSGIRIGKRIAPVLPHLTPPSIAGQEALWMAESDSGSDILGKQLELEAGNALQYRTCGWKKVRLRRCRKPSV